MHKMNTYLISVGFCSLVLTKSNGWNNTVEKVPENEPARNAFNTGCCKLKKKKTF